MLTELMFARVQSKISTQMALQLAHEFEQLAIEDLPVEDVYPAIMKQYSEDILMVARVYERSKKKPDVNRGAPPIAGTLNFCIATCICINNDNLICEVLLN